MLKNLFCKKEKADSKNILSQAIIIADIIKACNYNTYLELGIYFGDTYNHIKQFVDIADAVDIEPGKKIDKGTFYNMTTDEFFCNSIERKYDAIFIDALHEYDQVRKDFENALKALNKGGVIFLHDTDPQSVELLAANRCCDCYRMNEYLYQLDDVQFVTIPIDNCGITICRRTQDLRYKGFKMEK